MGYGAAAQAPSTDNYTPVHTLVPDVWMPGTELRSSEEQYMLLTTEPFLQPKIFFKENKFQNIGPIFNQIVFNSGS